MLLIAYYNILLPYPKNSVGTSGPQTARLACPAGSRPIGVPLSTKSPSA